VSWYDAVAYCNWLNEQENIPKHQWLYEANEEGEYAAGMKILADYRDRIGYRLPTEFEWEFVCRAGTESTYAFGDVTELLPSYAWIGEHSGTVGVKKPNALGVFDMHGNASEWTGILEGFVGSSVSVERRIINDDSCTLRGGSWRASPSNTRTAFRRPGKRTDRKSTLGFRLAKTYDLSR
jgi:formylglycine-generating enzyme required for sulfatase activity